jgi:hypothetical protein
MASMTEVFREAVVVACAALQGSILSLARRYERNTENRGQDRRPNIVTTVPGHF